MQNSITLVFHDHKEKTSTQVTVAAELAASLFSGALTILSLDARLLPNWREMKIYHDWLRGYEIEDPGRNTAYDPPAITIADKITEVRNELADAAVDKPRGGYPVFDRNKSRWSWNFNPASIAREMNRSNMFDFHVSPVHVEQAQAMLRGRK